jgi:hypothetical protein
VGAALLTGDIAADIAMPYLIENFQPWMYAAVIPSELAALALTLWIIARRLRYQPGKLEA